MRWPLKRLIVAGTLLGALAFAIWEAATATVRDVIAKPLTLTPIGYVEAVRCATGFPVVPGRRKPWLGKRWRNTLPYFTGLTLWDVRLVT